MKARLFIVFLVFSACSQHQQTRMDSSTTPLPDSIAVLTAAQAQQAGILLGTPRYGTLARRIQLRGSIELPPQNRISITFPLEGIVHSIAVLPGMFVRRGQVLATIEGMQLIELQEQYLSARVLAEQAEREYQRQRDLLLQQATSDRAVREAETLARQRRIAVRALAERLRLLGLVPEQMTDTSLSRAIALRSPIAGYVASVAVRTGQVLTPGQMIVELVDVGDVHLVLRAFEQDIPLVRPGQRLTVTVDADRRRLYSAYVVTIGHVLDSTRTAELHCHFDQYDPERLRPGMYAVAEVDVASTEGYILPRSAVVTWDNVPYIFVPKGHGYRMQPIRVLAQQADSLLVVSDNAEPLPNRVVLRGAYWLLMKLKNTASEE